MGKYEITLLYNADTTTFSISKASPLSKLTTFIETYYDELKSIPYEIIYNNINLKVVSQNETLSQIFSKKNEEQSLSQIALTIKASPISNNDTTILNVECEYKNEKKNFKISENLNFQKFKFNILSAFPPLEEENYQIMYNNEDITNYYSNETLLKDVFEISSKKTKNIEIIVETQPKIIIEYHKRCSFCHERKAKQICRKCALANCDLCSPCDTHNSTCDINFILLTNFKNFEQKTLLDMLTKLNLAKGENAKANSEKYSAMRKEKMDLLTMKFEEIISLVNAIKKEQIDNLNKIADEIENKFHPEDLANKINDLYNEILKYKNNPFYDCEESMRKILDFEKRLKFFMDEFYLYLSKLNEYNEKFRKCLNIAKKIIDFLTASLTETKLIFEKNPIETHSYNKIMKVYDNTSVLVFDANDSKFSLMNFHDDENKFKDNFNNFVQINSTFNLMQKIFIVTGAPCQKLFVYDLTSNEMQYISTMKYSHNWWPSLIYIKRKMKDTNEDEIVLFCLSGSYTNKCEMLIFNTNNNPNQPNVIQENQPIVNQNIPVTDSLDVNQNIENNNNNNNDNNNDNKNLIEDINTNSNKCQIMQWEEISSTQGMHGQGSAFILNESYIYVLFGYDFSLNPITIIEKIDITDLSKLITQEVKWEDLQFKNPDNISSILYYNSLLKIDDDNVFVLGGLVEVDTIDCVYQYSCKENALLKCKKKIEFNSVKFVNEKNFFLISKDATKKEYAVIDGKNNVHIIKGGTFEHKMITYNP